MKNILLLTALATLTLAAPAAAAQKPFARTTPKRKLSRLQAPPSNRPGFLNFWAAFTAGSAPQTGLQSTQAGTPESGRFIGGPALGAATATRYGGIGDTASSGSPSTSTHAGVISNTFPTSLSFDQRSTELRPYSSAPGPRRLSRDYVSNPPLICPYGSPAGEPGTGLCRYRGLVMAEAYPPPTPEGFVEREIYALEHWPGQGWGHRMLRMGAGAKWAVRFKAETTNAVQVGGLYALPLRSPMAMFVSVSRRPGDFDVAPGCLRTPASLANDDGGGAPNVDAVIELRFTRTPDAGQRQQAELGNLCILEPGGHYYLNVAGRCAPELDPDNLYREARDTWGCPVALSNINRYVNASMP
ncbi:MAG: hypothetical protein HY553_11560 [Elusimicrobia bacterium]|nr:hypothetical protein [Elusimicrobiota bacterium]